MRASRVCAAVTAVLVGVAALAGCGGGGSGGGPKTPAPASASPSASANPSATPSPRATPSPPATPSRPPETPGATPSSSRTLVRATRTGGFAGRTHTLLVAEDGSWTRLGAKAEPEGSGKLDPARLEAVRAALRAADLPRLPRVATAPTPVRDGFTYAFAHGGVEVTADQDSLAPGLVELLAALPGFEPAS